jgi:hypothetical protein
VSEKRSFDTDNVLILSIVVLVILFWGEPDLLDAIIKWLAPSLEPEINAP